jgi:peroxiredoxin
MNGFFLVSYVALWVLVAVMAVALLALYNHFGRMYLSSREGRATQGPAIGSTAPALQATALDGAGVSLPSGRPTLLLMASTDCPECGKLTAPLQDVARRRAAEMDVVVLCGGPPPRVAEWARDLHAPLRVVADRNFRRASDLGVGITPFVVGVDGDGVVRTKGLLNGDDGLQRAVRDLLEESALDDVRRIPLAAGARR